MPPAPMLNVTTVERDMRSPLSTPLPASTIQVGGQAVPEGVMMRAPGVWGIAIRTPDGSIVSESQPVTSLKEQHPAAGWPFVRGAVALGESMVVGVKAIKLALYYSTGNEKRQGDTVSRVQIGGAIVAALAMVVLLFKVVPLLIASTLPVGSGYGFLFTEGGIRVGMFVAYLAGVSALPHLQRLYQYHSAEHKTIHCYEKGLPLTPANVQAQSRIHPRCGTAFLLWVMVVAIFVYALVGHPALWVMVISRVVLLPVIAGVTYELIRLAARYERFRVVRAVMAPGLALQFLTTRPCELDQCEVAIVSLETALAAAEQGVFVAADRLGDLPAAA